LTIVYSGTEKFAGFSPWFPPLDNVLGEYYTEMSLSRIEKKLLNEHEVKNLHPIIDLPKVVQNHYSEWNN